MSDRLGILGLFPAFESSIFGGVQASGKHAWKGILDRASDSDSRRSAAAFFYQPGAPKLGTLLRAIAKRVNADTVLVWHSGLLKLTPFISKSGGRLVLFLHGIEAWRKHDPLTAALMRRTDLFLSNSDHTWNRFAALHPQCARAAHRTVHLGIGDRQDARTMPSEGPPTALMIGRLCRDENYKGHREIIELWPRLLESIPGAQLWIVGDGDLRPELEALSNALHIANSVMFFGAVPEPQKEDLLRRCRALVLPSAGEGFGLVYLEAMRLGRPCAVSSLDAGAEVVNPPEAGLSMDLRDPDQTVSVLARLLTLDRDWAEMAARAQARYESRFTARHFEQRLLAALFE